MNEPTEKELADMAKKLGLNEPKLDANFSDRSWFQGDFGYSLDIRFLMTMLILFSIVIFLIIYKKKKRKNKDL